MNDKDLEKTISQNDAPDTEPQILLNNLGKVGRQYLCNTNTMS